MKGQGITQTPRKQIKTGERCGQCGNKRRLLPHINICEDCAASLRENR